MTLAKTFRIRGMHCASCAATIEKTFKKVPGVASAEVNYATTTAKVAFDETQTNPEQLSKTIEHLGYSLVMPEPEDRSMPGMDHSMAGMNHSMTGMDHSMHTGVNQSKKEKLAELNALRNNLFSVIPLTIVSIFVMGWDIFAQFKQLPEMTVFWKEFFHHLLPIFATYTLFVVGKPYLLGLYRFFRYGAANMDTLIGLGTSAAFIYSFVVTAFEENLRPFINVDQTYYDVTIVVVAFITLGKYLEARSKLKTGDAIEKLLNLQAKTALVIRGGKEIEIAINAVVHDDVIIVKPAMKIPVDGTVIDGSSFVDESMVTGEPMPVKKEAGESVVAGTINTSGTFTFKATKVGSETLLAHIIKMVEEAQGSKAPIQALADKISAVFVPVVLVLSFVALGAWLIIGTPSLGFAQALSYGLVSFVGILVIACPCALGLATPTAIIVGVGKGAHEGILIKDAATLEKLYKVTAVVVDKTGTITKGKPELIAIEPAGKNAKEKIIALLAALESRSEHPLAHAIVTYAAAHDVTVAPIKEFISLKGKGVTGKIDGTDYFAGNTALIEELDLTVNKKTLTAAAKQGATPIMLATKDELLGTFMIADALKPEAKDAVARLHKLGIKVVMLTGDNQHTARAIADQVGIDDVVAEVLPHDKLQKIKDLQADGHVVAMAGDGVNDAPALAQADVGIAMSTGTDVAIESAGITLLNGDISKLLKAIRLSHLTMRGIKQNLFWAFIYNIVGIPLASGIFFPFFGWLLNPIFAGLAMAFSSVSVVSNSLRLKSKKL